MFQKPTRLPILLLLIFFCTPVKSQNKSNSSAPDLRLPLDTMVTSHHRVQIEGKEIPYSATAGTQPVYADDGHIIASLFYVYYKKEGVKKQENRPLTISFNGGPGTASVWMNIGFTGPRRLNIDEEGYPIEPYGIQNNPYSILDVTDIVFVCPVNTGYSQIIDPKVDKKKFFGVNADISYLSDWINLFVTRHNYWRSPKFLIGESYALLAFQDWHKLYKVSNGCISMELFWSPLLI